MRLRRFLPILGLAAASACATLRTTVDYDRSVDFTRYRTFAFGVGTPARAPFVQRRIEVAVSDELRARGLMEARRETADLVVSTHAIVEHQQFLETIEWGYGCRFGGAITTSTVRTIPVGTLIVNLVDREQDCLVWQARATDMVRSDRADRSEQLREALARMFAGFPGSPEGYRNRRELPQ